MIVWYLSATCPGAIRDTRVPSRNSPRRRLTLVWLIGWFLILCDFPDLLQYARQRYMENVASPLPELGASVSCHGPASTGEWTIVCFDKSSNDERFSQWVPHLLRLNVVVMNLPKTQITDCSIEKVRYVRNLKCLYVSHTAITDDALRHIGGLAELESLSLNDTRVSDDGLRNLKCLVHLRSVDAANTKVTERGAKMLEAAIPGVFVSFRQP